MSWFTTTLDVLLTVAKHMFSYNKESILENVEVKIQQEPWWSTWDIVHGKYNGVILVAIMALLTWCHIMVLVLFSCIRGRCSR
jgi:hypothetical protein